ncbi:MAG TPA: extracellular solute-binding protein [Hyphomicrobiaceae bacterium]|nr:extracellular solute-binding protein [Hyphomicrobiaceae bacterium]
MVQRIDRAVRAGMTGALLLAFLLATSPADAQSPAPQSPAPQSPAPQGTSQEAVHRHALSLVGEPRMPAGFKHFDWANPDAPKGGRLRRWDMGTFDSLNAFSIKGQAAEALGMIYDSLMSSSPDEPSTEYGLIAQWASYPDDYSSVTFKLRPEARWHDGQPITVDDVIFSLNALKAAHPQYAFYYKNVISAEKTGDHEVTFRFDVKGNRELPQIVGELTILPKHHWQAIGENSEKRDITKSSLEIPLGSGPYKIKSVDPGRAIIYERVADYWAKDLPVRKGLWNFDEISYTYYRDMTPAFEAFKSGAIDVWNENSANRWATQYDLDAVKKGAIKKEELKNARVAGMQAFVLNTRKPQFTDPRVRQAFNLAFDFDTLNKTLFYGQYIRTGSYFANSELAATGLPQGREKEILETIKDLIPPQVFTTVWKNPSAANPMDHRNNLRQAVKLMGEAGWTIKNGRLTNAKGEVMSAEFLLVQPDFERIVLPYIEDLKKIGIAATARIVDTSQYKRRLDSFDFDVVVGSFAQSHSPGNEQRDFWGSESAKHDGSRNLAGISNPAIDKLIDAIILAKDRADLVAATRALDRVLLWNNYVVPQWYYPFDRLASWDRFGRPEKLPSQSPGTTMSWWFDANKDDAVRTRLGR